MAENKLRLLEQSQEYDSGNNSLGLSANLVLSYNISVGGYTYLGGSNTPQTYFGGQPGFLMQDASNKSFAAFLRYDTSPYGASLALGKSNNATIGSTGLVSNANTSLGDIVFLASDGANGWIAGARIIVELDGAANSTSMPTRMRFLTTPSGSVTEEETIRIWEDGSITSNLNGTTPIWTSTSGGFQITGDASGLGTFFPRKGIEIAYIIGTNYGRILSYDRGNSAYQKLVFDASDVSIQNSGGTLTSLSGPAWTAPAFASGVSNYGSTFAPAGYYYDTTGRVYLRGLINITGNVINGGTIISSLPAPPYQVITNQPNQSGGIKRCDVMTSGQLVNESGANLTGWLSLEGISYQTKA